MELKTCLVLLLVGLGVASSTESLYARQGISRPNIIFFLVDDYDKPETSVYGGKVLTPSLERLAREGMTFHNAYMTSTVCTPSRYTCLTGRYAGSSYSPVYLWMDDSLGVLLDKLDELGIARNTLVLFIADHGSELKGSLYRHRGTEVPCIMRWPAGIRPGVQCHELIQNTDFVPTWFELAGVKRPPGYRMDGVSMASLFRHPDKSVRDYVYGEMGPSRSIKTKDWGYLALRYTKDQIEAVRSNSNRVIKKLQGLSGGVSRAKTREHAFDNDQLYCLPRDPLEQKNLVRNPEYRSQLKQMRALLSTELKRFPNRPYGEFVPGGNAVPMGSYDDVLLKMAQASKQEEKTPRRNRNRERRRKKEL